MSHTYETLRAAVLAAATGTDGSLLPGTWEASVGPHALQMTVRTRSNRARFQSLPYCSRGTREQLDAALAALPPDSQMSAYRSANDVRRPRRRK